MVSRREFARVTGSTLAALTLGTACRVSSEQARGADGRLTARPGPGVKTTGAPHRALGLGGARDAILHLPPSAGEASLPLLVLLHGAGGDADRMLARLGTAADEAGVAVLAPDSRGGTWDAIRGGFGPDVAFLDRALERVFTTIAVDPARMAIGGFSDGATYALSLGLINGDLFPRIVAFSPGFIVGGAPHGQPRCFLSHGRADEILPIDATSGRIRSVLRERGVDVAYREFAGGHEMPMPIVRDAMAWMTSPSGATPAAK